MNQRKSPRLTRMAPAPDPQLRPGLGAAARVPPSPDGVINILIVDDEPKNLTVLETVLDDPSYRLVRAESADEALLALVAEEFALLILDIRMPGMTGFELAQMIKERKKTADVPIIFLTAYYNNDQQVLEGYVSGAVDYLHKPVNASILRSKVAVFAELHRRNRESEIANRALLAEVTERRRTQEQLRELNETLEQRVKERTETLLLTSTALNETGARYRSLFDSSLDAIISLGTDGRFQAANPAALQLTGRTLDELKTVHFLDLCAPDQRDAANTAFRAAFRHECITIDTAVITASGERRDLFISGAPAILGGKLAGLSCIARDITERKRIEAEILGSEEKFRALLESAPDSMVIVDQQSTMVLANAQTERLFGYTREEILGQRVEILMPALFNGSHEGYFAAPSSPGTGAAVELVGRRKDGSEFPIEVSLSPLETEKGMLVCSAIRDITERKRVETELNVAMAAAEKANLAKSDFLSSMSHELRTPLNAVLGFAQLIESGSPPPTLSQQQSLKEILKGGWYLLELINEILDIAQIESGKLALTLESTPLTEVMRECLTMIEPQAQKRGISVSCPAIEIPYFVQADRVRLKQALLNLLSNAVKYNRRDGTVVMDCIVNTPGRIRVVIKDTGAGLAKEQLAQLFQPFNRLGQEGSAEEGTGIGLVVTKQLVELMEGAIGAESTAGVGSMFWIELNLTVEAQLTAVEPTAATPAQIQADAPLRTLLYVEDNLANLRLVENLIARRSDIRLLTAMDGKHGIEIARTSVPDVILIDINLPGINGIEAMRILHADPATAHIPVVALSANAMPRDIQTGLEAGFFRYLTKPIKVNAFMETLDMALKSAQSAPADGVKKESL